MLLPLVWEAGEGLTEGCDSREKAGENLPLLVGNRLCFMLEGVLPRNKNALARPRSRRPKGSRSFHVRA